MLSSAVFDLKNRLDIYNHCKEWKDMEGPFCPLFDFLGHGYTAIKRCNEILSIKELVEEFDTDLESLLKEEKEEKQIDISKLRTLRSHSKKLKDEIDKFLTERKNNRGDIENRTFFKRFNSLRDLLDEIIETTIKLEAERAEGRALKDQKSPLTGAREITLSIKDDMILLYKSIIEITDNKRNSIFQTQNGNQTPKEYFEELRLRVLRLAKDTNIHRKEDNPEGE